METMEIENEIMKIKSALRFLLESEKNRKAEVEALKEAVGGVDSYCKEYVDGQEFNAFKDSFGDKLDPYSEKFAVMEKKPDYDFTREVYDEYKGLSDEELKNVTQEDFVEVAIKKADEYIETIKEKLGLPADAKVEVTTDENGETEVKADVDGDGQTESIEMTEETKTEDSTAEENPEATEEDTTAKEMEEINKAVDEMRK